MSRITALATISVTIPILSEGRIRDTICGARSGIRENDARIVKLLAAHGVTVWPSNPLRDSGLRPIVVDRFDQMECAEKLLFEAAVRGEITVVFGPGPGYGPPTTQRSAKP